MQKITLLTLSIFLLFLAPVLGQGPTERQLDLLGKKLLKVLQNNNNGMNLEIQNFVNSNKEVTPLGEYIANVFYMVLSNNNKKTFNIVDRRHLKDLSAEAT